MADWLAKFGTAAVNGVPLFLVVFVLVELMKRLKKSDGSPAVSGNGLLLASFGWGLLLGIGNILFSARPPGVGDWYAIYVYWFAAVVYGIALGGTASVFFEVVKGLVERIAKATANG
jgi:hypothetical protein